MSFSPKATGSNTSNISNQTKNDTQKNAIDPPSTETIAKRQTNKTRVNTYPSFEMILFETSTSVFELLWDIALALFIIRLSFFYFALSFLSGCMLTFLRVARLQPINHLTQPQSELITLPLFLLFNTLWARFIIVNYEVPRVGGFRLAIGGLALGFMLVAELLGGMWMWEEGWNEWIWETDFVAGGLGGLVLLLFGLMPFMMMGMEAQTDEMGETYHGHEKKPIVAAVPTVAVSEKEAVNGKKTQ